MSRTNRIAALLLAAAVTVPAAASDVDAHFDRSRGKPPAARSAAPPAADATRAGVAGSEPSQVRVEKGEPVTLVVTPKAGGPCALDVRAR